MARVTRREKATDSKYSKSIETRPALSSREPIIDDIVEDLRDDVNGLCDLANKINDFTFTYTAASGKTRAKLTIEHTASRKQFVISATS